MSYVIVAEFQVKPGCVEAFAEAIDRHAYNSRTLEDGCLVFDVCQLQSEPQRFLLYEVYRDEQAYQAHRTMASYCTFFETVTDMLIARDGQWFQNRLVLSRRAHLEMA